jgi:hypothetical protein
MGGRDWSLNDAFIDSKSDKLNTAIPHSRGWAQNSRDGMVKTLQRFAVSLLDLVEF